MNEWCVALEKGTELKLPWRLLRGRIAELDAPTGTVKYETTFEDPPATNSEVEYYNSWKEFSSEKHKGRGRMEKVKN